MALFPFARITEVGRVAGTGLWMSVLCGATGVNRMGDVVRDGLRDG